MRKVSPLDRFWYLIICLTSLGMAYLLKIIIVNALIESENSKN